MLARSNSKLFVKNSVLASLTRSDLVALGPYLEPVVLEERMVLHQPNGHVEDIYFVESGVVSQRIVAAGSSIETAMVGYQGVVGAPFVFGGHILTHQSVVLFPGRALRIDVSDLRRLMGERSQIREHLLRYVQAFAMHAAQTALCGVRHSLEQRLACWLCLTCDAIDGDVLPVTHGYFSVALGLRRSGVTNALNRFEEQGLIRKTRGVLQVDDRERIEHKACSCYDVIAGAYASLEV